MDEINSSDNSQIQWLAFDDLMERWGIVDFKGFFYAIVHQDLPVYKFADGKHEKLDFKGQFTTPGNFNDENVFSHFPKFKEWIFNLDDIEEWDKILGIDYHRWAIFRHWTVHQAACLLSYEDPEKMYEGLTRPVKTVSYPPGFSPFVKLMKLREKMDTGLKPIIDYPSIVKLKSKIERAVGAGKIRQVGTGATGIRLDVKNVLGWAVKRGITVPSKLIEETNLVDYSGGFYDEGTWHNIEPGGYSVLEKEKKEALTLTAPSVPSTAPPTMEPECDKFVRELRVYYENDSEIKVQTPRKPLESLNLSILGFHNEEAVPWKDFLNILQNPEHTYSCGPSTLGKAYGAHKNPVYSRNQKRLQSLSAKLIGGLNKVYQVGIPEKYSLFERVPGKQGTYKPKFKIEDRPGINPIEEKYDRYSKDRLLKEIENLFENYKAAQAEAQEQIANSIFAKLVPAATVAHRKKWVTEEKIIELFSPDGNNGDISGLDLSNQDSHKLLYGFNREE